MATDVRSERATPKPRVGIKAVGTSRQAGPQSTNPRRAWWVRAIAAVVIVAVVATAASFMLGARSPEEVEPKLLHTLARRNLDVTVTEQGTLESSNNTEVRCKVRGANSTIVWIIENGTEVKPDDVLVRLDTSTIEDNINSQKIAYQAALATFAQSESDVAVAKINITEYLEGTYRSELKTKEKDVAIAKANLVSAQNIVEHARKMFKKGYISSLEVESSEFFSAASRTGVGGQRDRVGCPGTLYQSQATPGLERHSEGKGSQAGLRHGGTRSGEGKTRSRRAATRELRDSGGSRREW